MNKNYSIAFITGSRAEYGIMRSFLTLLNKDPEISLSILATGSLLSEKFGRQIELIYRDGFKVEAEVQTPIGPSTNSAITNSMSLGLNKFGEIFSQKNYDLVIILGDRYEMLPAAIAAAINRIPILHIHGGEATFANYDEFIRHCITKMATYHFTATESYKKRVIQLGENPNNVYCLGSLGAENCTHINIDSVSSEIKKFIGDSYFVVIYNPETLKNESDTESQIKALLSAISQKNDYKFIILGSNADTHSDTIRNSIKKCVDTFEHIFFFENLPTNDYHFLLKNSFGLIGNSSSGIIEAPSLGISTINIGDRQAGRIRGNSVIDIKCTEQDILNAINEVVSKRGKITINNPYYKENAAVSEQEQKYRI